MFDIDEWTVRNASEANSGMSSSREMLGNEQPINSLKCDWLSIVWFSFFGVAVCESEAEAKAKAKPKTRTRIFAG